MMRYGSVFSKEVGKMEKRIKFKAIMVGVALAALVFVRPALSQEEGCFAVLSEGCGGEEQPPCPITCPFPPGISTQKYVFGTHFIKVTANFNSSYPLTIEFVPISSNPSGSNPDLDPRLNTALAPANCVPYDGATSTTLGGCGFYHVDNPPGPSLFTDVDFKVFWNFPTLDALNNVRLYRAPLDGFGYDCEGGGTGFDGSECYTQDITTAVFAVGDATTGDPGVGGKSKPPGFSDFQVVDLASPTSPAARVLIGLKKTKDTGILFDLKAVVKRNGDEVSSGTLFGAPGGGVGFNNANLLTIPLSLPADAFQVGDNVSIKLFARNSCLGSPQNSGTARLWYNDTAANSRFDEPGAPTLYLVRGDDDGEQEWEDHGDNGSDLSKNPGNGPKKKKNVKVHAPVPTCDGPYKSFGKWSGKVPN
jgi:hypothetical protein